MSPLDRRLCVAPMIDWTDRHCRYFHRLIAPRALLYTEMVTTGAILRGRDPDRFLDFDVREKPVALQLGGSEPEDLAVCARLGEVRGYAEIDLNCGCPSERVQKGSFGACLMREPALVAECVMAMREATVLPITVKCRTGVDRSGPELLWRFVEAIVAAGCGTLILHARQAWLQGLSPKENRELPALSWHTAREIKAAFPGLQVVLNGGLRDPLTAQREVVGLDGVMIGREAYENPWSLRAFEAALLGAPSSTPLSREAVVRVMIGYAREQRMQGVPVRAVTRHMLGLMNGLPGARAWRRCLSERTLAAGAEASVLEEALALVGPRTRQAA